MAPAPSRSRTSLVIGVVVAAVVAVAAVAAWVATRGDDDEEDGDAPAECLYTPSSVPAVPPGDGGEFGTVDVEGEWLVPWRDANDPCIGQPVPTVRGEDYAGNPVAITPGLDGPMMIVVMAHWCPHCNNEVPLLVEWGESGQVPENLTVVGVSTAANADREHFPPSEWLAEEMRWSWPVIADDQIQTGAAALGTPGYPYLMFVDADGNLMARASGELPISEVQRLADAAAATA